MATEHVSNIQPRTNNVGAPIVLSGNVQAHDPALLRKGKQVSKLASTPFQTVVFSRKTTYHGPDGEVTPAFKKDEVKNQEQEQAHSPLSQLVHQTDRSGKAMTVAQPHNINSQRNMKPISQSDRTSSGISKLFQNICSALGMNEQQQLQLQQQQKLQEGKQDPNSVTNVLEMRPSILGAPLSCDVGKKCLVLDLDETLVHSSFKPTTNPDYIIPVEIEGHVHQVYVCKRPGVDEFLRNLASMYEIVVYTASLSKYADPLLDLLDPHRVIRFRLFREHCVHYEGSYVKDLSLLDRDLAHSIIIDNSPMSYLFHPRNAIGCSSFVDDMKDRELESIFRFLVAIKDVPDVRNHLHVWNPNY